MAAANRARHVISPTTPVRAEVGRSVVMIPLPPFDDDKHATTSGVIA
jgi:hypothetical protein